MGLYAISIPNYFSNNIIIYIVQFNSKYQKSKNMQ